MTILQMRLTSISGYTNLGKTQKRHHGGKYTFTIIQRKVIHDQPFGGMFGGMFGVLCFYIKNMDVLC